MEKRDKIIFEFLTKQNGYITIQEIASVFSVSARAVRYSLSTIDIFLGNKGLSKIERKTGVGVCLNRNELDTLCSLNKSISNPDAVPEFYEPNERLVILFYLIYISQKRIVIEELVDILKVSARTIRSDVSILRNKLKLQKCDIIFLIKEGYRLIGDEVVLRTIFINLLVSSNRNENDFTLLTGYQLIHNLYFTEVSTAFDKCCQETFETIKLVLPASFPETSIAYICIFLLLAQDSNRKDFFQKIATKEKSYIEDTTWYELAQIIITKIKIAVSGWDILDDENYFLTIFLNSVPTNKIIKHDQNYPFEFELLAHQIVQIVSEKEQFPFFDDHELYEIILKHMIPAYYRVKNNNQIKNPLLNRIEEKYASLTVAVKNSLEKFETFTSGKLTDDEVSFFTIYFASSYEKIVNLKRKAQHVIVVCNSGFAVSRLLQYKIANLFTVNVDAFVSTNDLEKALSDYQPDLVIGVSDVDLKLLGPIPYLKVSALLSNSDIANLKKHLTFRREEPERENEQTDLIKGVITDSKMKGILDFLTEEYCLFSLRTKSLEELIILSGNILKKNGNIGDNYIRDMVKGAHRFGGALQIKIAPRMIMPHAGISDDVYNVGFSLVLLEEPLFLDNEPIFASLAMCTTHPKIQQKAIQEVAKLLAIPEFLQKFYYTKNYNELRELIKTFLERKH